MPYSLLFVSKALVERPAVEAEATKIAIVSAHRNGELGITGAMLCTGTYFGQVLEGPQDAVETVMARIDADPRHLRPRIIRATEEPRRFSGWSLVYNGSAGFVDRQIAPFFTGLLAGDAARLALRLVGLMEEFARMPQS